MMRLVMLLAALAPTPWLLGCSSCGPWASNATAPDRTLTLDGSTNDAILHLDVHAPSQTCGCTWCGDPVVTVDLGAELSWSGASGANDPAYPVVRFTLTPNFAPAQGDELVPLLPLDTALTLAAPTEEPTLHATHLCSGDGCDLDYTLTVARVDQAHVGTVLVVLRTAARYVSKDTGELQVTLDP